MTFASGCGEPTPEPVHPNPPGPTDGPTNNPPAPTDTAPAPDPTGTFATPPEDSPTAAPTASNRPAPKPAPAGWTVRKNEDGTCTAYGKDPCNHPGCNPPPPMYNVICPPDAQP